MRKLLITDPRDSYYIWTVRSFASIWFVERMEAAGLRKLLNIEENFSDEEIDYRLHNSNDIRELILSARSTKLFDFYKYINPSYFF